MKLQTEIGLLKKEIEKINDEHLLNAIKELIKFARQKNEDELLKPFTQKEVISRAQQSEKDISQKKYTPVSKLRRKLKSL